MTAFMSAGTKVAAFLALVRVLDVGFQPSTGTGAARVGAGRRLGGRRRRARDRADRREADARLFERRARGVRPHRRSPPRTRRDPRGDVLPGRVSRSWSLGAFGVVMLVSIRGEERTGLNAYRGSGALEPAAGRAACALFLLSLAGIPPTAGFVAKVAVFQAAIDAGYWPLVLIGVLASVVAAFFYLRVDGAHVHGPHARRPPSSTRRSWLAPPSRSPRPSRCCSGCSPASSSAPGTGGDHPMVSLPRLALEPRVPLGWST